MTIRKMWECDECGTRHKYEDDARDCCKPKVSEVYVCPECDEGHGTMHDAEICCDSNPEARSRGPSGIELEALGQTRLFR